MASTLVVNELKDATEKVYQTAERVYGRNFSRPRICVNLRGATAGLARIVLGYSEIRYNEALYLANKEQFISRTVPHEVAHLLVYELYGRRMKPHGLEWQTVCRKIGMTDIERCHDYDVTGLVTRRSRPYLYSCGCKQFHLTVTIHRRIMMGQKRCCLKCRGQLKFVGC